ncbi:cation transporter [Nonomuraea glycinis]|uniref:cation transporter n=1 Tax=Nonomuraea glycinis TaxID=2047744 RepID=UPI0033ADD037
MSDARLPAVTGSAARRAVGYARFTIGYNVVEGVIALAAGAGASAISLIGFGIDSASRWSPPRWCSPGCSPRSGAASLIRSRALKFIAITFFALAAYVVEGVRDLIGGEAPDTSIVGIALTSVSIAVMPALAHLKRKAGREMNSRLVIADAAETRPCAWLSVSTCAGLLAYAAFGWTWIDAVAGFVIAAFAVMEGREAWEGELVCDD